MNSDASLESEEFVLGVKMPSYSFAKRQGVLLKQDLNKTEIFFLDRTSSQALCEMRRLVDKAATFIKIDEERFDQMLQAVYEQKSGQAQKMVDDMQDNIDLSYMAQHLPTPDDLLERALVHK